ncbi:MAG TPA: hypothetical protein VFW87_19185 [Pirellulales bacterium]|nr:hypothetical protein [Pirellulales bacterium]
MGTGAILWLMILFAALALSIAGRGRLGPWILSAGITLFAYLAASVMFGLPFPYRTHGVSIYLIFFAASTLTVCGSVGVALRWFRR